MQVTSEEVKEVILNTQKLGKIKQKLASLSYRTERPPAYREPLAMASYENIAAKIGIKGREFELLFDSIIRDPDDHEIEALGRMITLAKLKNPEVLKPYHEQVQRSREQFEHETISYQKALQTKAELEDELKLLMTNTAVVNLRDEFTKVINQVRSHVEEHENVVTKFSGEEAEFFELLVKHSRFVHKLPNEMGILLAQVDWDEVAEFNIEHINTIFRAWCKHLQEKEKA
jgi:hypothetical protein